MVTIKNSNNHQKAINLSQNLTQIAEEKLLNVAGIALESFGFWLLKNISSVKFVNKNLKIKI